MKRTGVLYRFPHMCLILGALVCAPRLSAQMVYQPELMSHGRVEFINYEGPVVRFETREQIRAIGYDLGQQVRAGVTQTGLRLRYFVIHSVSPPDGNRLDADIFGIGVDAAVNHVRNLRFIIQGYLEAAYGYSASDGALLAEYITIYNAVFRGNWNFFVSRYKAPVIGHLTMESAGLSLRFDEWPGQTLMLIPLGSGLGGQLSAIDIGALNNGQVIDHFRQEPDMGLDQRRDMVDLLEREAGAAAQLAAIVREGIEEEEARIAGEMQAAQQQEQDAQQQLQQIAEAMQQPGADQQALVQLEQAAQQQQQDAQQQQEELAQQQQALAQQQQQAEQHEAFAEERLELAQEQRELIAEDQQTLIDMAPAVQVVTEGSVLGVSILAQASSLGRVVRLDPLSGREIRRSPLTTVNTNTITLVNDRLLAIAGENRGNAAIRLVEIDEDTLEMIRHGDDDIAPGSLLWLNGQHLYAITSAGGNLYMARFNTDMVLQARSSMTVHPFASVLFYGNYILTQRADGSAAVLNSMNMMERR